MNNDLPVSDKNMQQKRRDFLIKLLSCENLKTQNEIAQKLICEGFDGSQPTINRDIKALGILKSSEGFYVIDSELKKKMQEDELSDLLSISSADSFFPTSFFTVKTTSGYENLVSMKIKDAFPDDVLSYFTRDGFIVVFTKSDDVSKRLSSKIQSLIKAK